MTMRKWERQTDRHRDTEKEKDRDGEARERERGEREPKSVRQLRIVGSESSCWNAFVEV